MWLLERLTGGTTTVSTTPTPTNAPYTLEKPNPILTNQNILNIQEEIKKPVINVKQNNIKRFGGDRKNVSPNKEHDMEDFSLGGVQQQLNVKIKELDFVCGTDSKDCSSVDNKGQQLIPSQKVFMETYGCQMNVNDTEVVLSVLNDYGYEQSNTLDDADVVLLNTCAIRDNAEQKIWQRLRELKGMKERSEGKRGKATVVGVLGCMAERLKEDLLAEKKLVDLVCGPDAYRDVPRLIKMVQGAEEQGEELGHEAINVQLSMEETYADITPVRKPGTVSAFVSIMRGCNNMCTFCIVPHTRGVERSRPVESILREIKQLSEQGVKEVVLLGQNVNSYADFSERDQQQQQREQNSQNGSSVATHHKPDPYAVYAKGFKTRYRPRRDGAVTFAQLLDRVAQVDPEMRIRFTSPHPKDFSDEVLEIVNRYPNICNWINMPAQSGNSACLQRMRRGYSREAYIQLVDHIREIIPNVALCTDIIVGFCGETYEEFNDTLNLMRYVKYDQAFMFAYSDRGKTYASRHYQDDVPSDVKAARLQQIVATFREKLLQQNLLEVGKLHLILVEGHSKKSKNDLVGHTDTFKSVVIPNQPICRLSGNPNEKEEIKVGDYVCVRITKATSGTLFGELVGKTNIQEFYNLYGSCGPVTIRR